MAEKRVKEKRDALSEYREDTNKQMTTGFDEVEDACTETRLAMKQVQDRLEARMNADTVAGIEGEKIADNEILTLLRAKIEATGAREERNQTVTKRETPTADDNTPTTQPYTAFPSLRSDPSRDRDQKTPILLHRLSEQDTPVVWDDIPSKCDAYSAGVNSGTVRMISHCFFIEIFGVMYWRDFQRWTR